MARLFAYGSLMCPDIFERVSGAAPVCEQASVKNHRCLLVRGETYPGMVRAQGHRVEGQVYTFSSKHWPALDAFEGEMYARRSVIAWFADGSRGLVHTYIFNPLYRSRLSRTPWDFETFLASGKDAFMRSYLAGYEAEEAAKPFAWRAAVSRSR